MIVLPVRIIMSPTSSSRFFVGRTARSATLRTIHHPPQGTSMTRRHFWAPSRPGGSYGSTRIHAKPQLRMWIGSLEARGTVRAVRRVLAFTACCAILVGCGGGARQDADETAATYDV